MARPRKSNGETFYPPRGMRADRAAAYLDMSESSFLTLVREGDMPPGVPIRGMTIWDRYELDAAFENFKDRRQRRRNTVNEALGIKDDDAAVIMGIKNDDALWTPIEGPAERRDKEREQARHEKRVQRAADEKARELKRQIKAHREERRKPIGPNDPQ